MQTNFLIVNFFLHSYREYFCSTQITMTSSIPYKAKVNAKTLNFTLKLCSLYPDLLKNASPFYRLVSFCSLWESWGGHFEHALLQWLNSAEMGRNGVPQPVSGVPPPEIAVSPPKVVAPPPITAYCNMASSSVYLVSWFSGKSLQLLLTALPQTP